ncbi:MAG: efflux RND transporter permease subunit, partial [Lysobacteraceae bacterium]
MALGNSSGDSAFHRALERVIFNNRGIVMVFFAIVTVAMAFFASQLRVDAGFMKQIPREHPYMSTFVEYMAEFGGANRVLVAVVAKDSDIFDQQYMATLENVTKDVMAMDATDDARVRSLFTPNTRFVEVVEDGFAGGNVIPDTFLPNVEGYTASPEDFDRIRGNIVKANILGRLVARDWSATMVWAELIPEDQAPGGKLDYQAIGDELEGIRAKYESDQYSVHIIGFAKMVDDIADGAASVVIFFAITIAFTWLLLFIYSTSAKLATLTVFASFVAVIWMLGALRLLGYGIDPMNMLTPFLIFAIAVSHGEQMINRFRGEIFFGGMEDGSPEELRQRHGISPLEAAKASFRMLLIPGTVALAAGCIGFATIMLIEIQMVRELAITATVGVGLTVLTNLVLLPVLLSYTTLRNMEKKREFRLRQLTQFDKVWAVLSRLSKPGPAAIVVVAGVAIWFFA